MAKIPSAYPIMIAQNKNLILQDSYFPKAIIRYRQKLTRMQDGRFERNLSPLNIPFDPRTFLFNPTFQLQFTYNRLMQRLNDMAKSVPRRESAKVDKKYGKRFLYIFG